MKDITPNDIKRTITFLENLDDTKYFANSSIILGMLEVLNDLQIDVSQLYMGDNEFDDEQEALDSLLDGWHDGIYRHRFTWRNPCNRNLSS